MMARGGGGGGGRERPRRDFEREYEEKGRQSGWGVAPPSRHLWVGNLNPRVTYSALKEQFLGFGDLENVVYAPGRSFAFVNYRREQDAIIAFRALQGVVVGGTPLRIEFAKGDKSPLSSLGKEYPRYNDNKHAFKHGESFTHRDTRPVRRSPGSSYEISKGNKNAEPCEMLWVGFPASVSVDETGLRKAFSPFGEIEKITTFPGRTFAFVQFTSVAAACRAKEALHGKLFNNPRIQVCFAKTDAAATEQGSSMIGRPLPPHFTSDCHVGPSGRSIEAFQGDRSLENPTAGFQMASPGFVSQSELMFGDAGDVSFGRNVFARAGMSPGQSSGASFEHGRLQEFGPQRRKLEDTYEYYRNSPAAEAYTPWNDLPPERPRRSPYFEDSWGLEEGHFPLPKKLKIDSLPDAELPEYPFTDLIRERHDSFPSRPLPNIHEPRSFHSNVVPLTSGYKGAPDYPRNLPPRPHAGTDDTWRNFGDFDAGRSPPPLVSGKLSEFYRPPVKEVWKWEGTIAKSGTPVCRARCFPVGKVLEFMLPDTLDCTSRTGLDMLAKHYYQAASSWVVFFVPETDADIGFYNEFLHYLGEKQRAAVAKLGEKITLFLVPPSEFSEQVLKVPGQLSISGVILQFQQASSNFSASQHPKDITEPKLTFPMPRLSDSSESLTHPEFAQGQSFCGFSSAQLAQVHSGQPPRKTGDNFLQQGPSRPVDNLNNLHEGQHDLHQRQNSGLQSGWMSEMHFPKQSSNSLPPPDAASHSFANPMGEKFPLVNLGTAQETTPGNYVPDTSGRLPVPTSKFPPQQEIKPQLSSSQPLPLQPEQLVQLAAFLGQQKQPRKETVVSTEGINKESSMLLGNSSLIANSSASPVTLGSQIVPASFPSISVTPQITHSSVSSELSRPQIIHASESLSSGGLQNKAQPSQPHPLNISAIQGISGQLFNQPPDREDADADPQKRLQATLQLAAVLLQQIQHQSKT